MENAVFKGGVCQFCTVSFNQRRNKIGFIVIKHDDWNGISIVINHLGRPKIFSCESEAIDYCKEMEVNPFQIVEVTI
jgi:hypothetical protein